MSTEQAKTHKERIAEIDKEIKELDKKIKALTKKIDPLKVKQNDALEEIRRIGEEQGFYKIGVSITKERKAKAEASGVLTEWKQWVKKHKKTIDYWVNHEGANAKKLRDLEAEQIKILDKKTDLKNERIKCVLNQNFAEIRARVKTK